MNIRGTYHLSMAGIETEPIRALILRRRLQILIHSCIYYRLNESLVSDDTWNEWAQELVKLQKQYPKISERVDYHGDFEGFDGSTGMDLPMGKIEILNKARQLIERSKDSGRHKIKSIRVPGGRRNNKRTRD